MAFTYRDFETVAAIIREAREAAPASDEAQTTIRAVATGLTLHFSVSNPRFNGLSFLRACGLETPAAPRPTLSELLAQAAETPNHMIRLRMGTLEGWDIWLEICHGLRRAEYFYANEPITSAQAEAHLEVYYALNPETKE